MTLSMSRRRDHARARRTTVFFNGKEITRTCKVLYADARRGVIRRYARDEHGRLFPDATGNSLMKEEIRGRVRIKVAR